MRPRRSCVWAIIFTTREGPERLDAESKKAVIALMRGRRFVWIEGNHDAAAALVLGGESAPEIEIGPLVFRHEPQTRGARGELAGHLHPVASVSTRAQRVRRRCFVSDGLRCVLPAFGAFAGGLDVFDSAFARLFPQKFNAYLLGRERVYPFDHSRLGGGLSLARRRARAVRGRRRRLARSSAPIRRRR